MSGILRNSLAEFQISHVYTQMNGNATVMFLNKRNFMLGRTWDNSWLESVVVVRWLTVRNQQNVVLTSEQCVIISQYINKMIIYNVVCLDHRVGKAIDGFPGRFPVYWKNSFTYIALASKNSPGKTSPSPPVTWKILAFGGPVVRIVWVHNTFGLEPYASCKWTSLDRFIWAGSPQVQLAQALSPSSLLSTCSWGTTPWIPTHRVDKTLTSRSSHFNAWVWVQIFL